ncbi:MAG: hypothetical protein ACR2IE_20385 [Candidatus Sumerlaeaceae bacterium]
MAGGSALDNWLNRRTFRWLLTGFIFLIVLVVLIAFWEPVPPEVADIELTDSLAESYPYLVISAAGLLCAGWLVALVGLYWFRDWARVLFTFSSLALLLVCLVFGTTISPPIGTMVASAAEMYNGALLAILFLPPIKAEFRRPRETSP